MDLLNGKEILKNKINDNIEIIKKMKDIKCIYFLIKNNDIVYIGYSFNLRERLKIHRSYRKHKRKYYKKFDSFYYIEYLLIDIEIIEVLYIDKFKPKYNKLYKDITSIIIMKNCLGKYISRCKILKTI